MYQDLKEFCNVAVKVENDIFETDGFFEQVKTNVVKTRGPRFYDRFHAIHQWMLTNIPRNKVKTKTNGTCLFQTQ